MRNYIILLFITLLNFNVHAAGNHDHDHDHENEKSAPVISVVQSGLKAMSEFILVGENERQLVGFFSSSEEKAEVYSLNESVLTKNSYDCTKNPSTNEVGCLYRNSNEITQDRQESNLFQLEEIEAALGFALKMVSKDEALSVSSVKLWQTKINNEDYIGIKFVMSNDKVALLQCHSTSDHDDSHDHSRHSFAPKAKSFYPQDEDADMDCHLSLFVPNEPERSN